MLDFHCYLITERTQTGGRDLIDALVQAARAGVRAVQLRVKDLPPAELFQLAVATKNALAPFGTRILVNDRADIALAAGLDGVHLTTTSMPVAAVRDILRPGMLIGVSTHTPATALAAQQGGADFITYGPVYATPSKAGYGAPRGVAELRTVCTALDMPVFALGGVGVAEISACRAAGAYGVAAIRALLDVPDIAVAVAAFRVQLGDL